MLNFHNYSTIKFPENFLWGSATSAHQIEGDDIYSINWRDQAEGYCDQPSGHACNSYKLYKEDVELIKQLGHHAYRLSIPWSRIEPEENKFCFEAVKHYIDLLQRLQQAGIKPFVTLSHGSDPAWFWDKGGFGKRESLHYFDRYVDFIVPKLESSTEYWMTINEINIMQRHDVDTYELRKNYLICHAHAYHIIKQYSTKPVAAPHAMSCPMPRDPYFEADVAMAAMEDWILNGSFYHALRTGEMVYPHTNSETISEMKDSFDFWAINYYTRQLVSSRTQSGSGKTYNYDTLKMIDKPFYIGSFYPEGLYTGLQRLKDKPVYITENGTCCADDRWRIVKMAMDLAEIKEAIDHGIDVRSYLHWSLLDNYEWVSYIPRFGLVEVDFETFERTPKPSAWFYKEIIESNALSPAVIAKYLPELPQFKLFK